MYSVHVFASEKSHNSLVLCTSIGTYFYKLATNGKKVIG